jgi:hypothetical protein
VSSASVSASVRSSGADLRAIADELRRMDGTRVKALFRKRLTDAAKPVVPRVRASVMAIPVKGTSGTTGLRARIAECVQVASWDSGPRQISVAVEVDAHKMPSGQRSLPAYMEGAKPRWRHPVYGRRENPADWQAQSSHPYFYGPARSFGQAAGRALEAALEDITRQIDG